MSDIFGRNVVLHAVEDERTGCVLDLLRRLHFRLAARWNTVITFQASYAKEGDAAAFAMPNVFG